ncbi:MAG: hypothetical protein M0R74_10645 [Dehalococcoidia bacterium]|nr:hypothetical protein [Dehalococcoidia bacterium]
MASQHEKGQGAYVAPHMSMRQKLLLGDWAKEHEPDCRRKTYAELAAQASADTTVGFPVTASNMGSVCVARFGNKRGHSNGNGLSALTARIAECERRLTAAGA